MIQGKTIIIALMALIVGFGAGIVLRPVVAPAHQTVAAVGPAVTMAPRATQYFAAHLDDAHQVVAECQSGSLQGVECANAGQAVTEAEGKERFRRFMGN